MFIGEKTSPYEQNNPAGMMIGEALLGPRLELLCWNKDQHVLPGTPNR